MIKKILCFLLCCFIYTGVFAEQQKTTAFSGTIFSKIGNFSATDKTQPEITEVSFKESIGLYPEKTNIVLKEYISDPGVREKVLKDLMQSYEGTKTLTGVYGIYKSMLKQICTTAGWDLKQEAGRNKCVEFVGALIAVWSDSVNEACGKDKDKKGAICETNMFSNLTMTMDQAEGLASLYALKMYGDELVTNPKARKDIKNGVINYYVQGKSENSTRFYEFKFMNTDGNIDSQNHKEYKKAICKIFNAEYDTKKLPYDEDMDQHTLKFCKGISDETTCRDYNKYLDSANMGYYFLWGPSLCVFPDPTVIERKLGYLPSNIGKCRWIDATDYPYCMLESDSEIEFAMDDVINVAPFGLDSKIFLNTGMQRKTSSEIRQQICQYVESVMGKEYVESCDCEKTYHTVKVKGRKGTDDKKVCRINGRDVAFYFDDLSESSILEDKAGREGMNCVISGGTYTGKECIGLNEQMCNMVRDQTAKACPECKQVKWNNETKICELPNAEKAYKLKKGVKIFVMIGGAVVSVILTVATFGGAGVVGLVVITAETVGTALSVGMRLKIEATPEEFFAESAKCNSAECAEVLIGAYLNRLANLQSSFGTITVYAIDNMMSRLASYIPPESAFYQDLVKKGVSIKDNGGGMEPEQFWMHVGDLLLSIGLITNVAKWFTGAAPKLQNLNKFITTVSDKIDEAKKLHSNLKYVPIFNPLDEGKINKYEKMKDFFNGDIGKEGRLWYE